MNTNQGKTGGKGKALKNVTAGVLLGAVVALPLFGSALWGQGRGEAGSSAPAAGAGTQAGISAYAYAPVATPCPQCAWPTPQPAMTPPVVSTADPDPFVQVWLPDGTEMSGVQLLDTVYSQWRTLPPDAYYRWFHSYVEHAVIKGSVWVRTHDLNLATAGWNGQDTEPRVLMMGCDTEAPLGYINFDGAVVSAACIGAHCQLVVQPSAIY